MPDSFPPLTALRAFEVASRHLSFSKAAEELFVTPAAISQQIRSLEEHLGVQLFHRHSRSLALTSEAEAGLARLREGFDAIAEAVKQIRGAGKRDTLAVFAAPTFASKWLVPRLHRFSSRYPDINLRIEADTHLVDHRRENMSMSDYLHRHSIDVAISFGRGDYPDCQVDKLLAATAAPLCSPQLLKGEHPLNTPADLHHHTLLHDDTHYEGRPGWREWCQQAGLEGLDTERGMRFNHVALALEAAIDGQGVILSLEQIAAPAISAGRLVVPFERRLALQNAYFIVSPDAVAQHSQVKAFREWLLSESASTSVDTRKKPQRKKALRQVV